MRRQLFSASPGKHYRRGAVMGLTVAEAFMLVAFVLLLLLLFWRHQVQDAVDLAAKFSPEQQQALLKGAVPVPPDRLAELKKKERKLDDPARRILAKGEVPIGRERMAELEKKERQLADPALRALAKAAAKLPPDKLRKLTDLARNPEALSDDAATVPKKRLAELEDKERRLDNPARRVLAEGEVPVPQERLEALEKTDRLLAGPSRRALAEAAATLPPETLRRLTDLAHKPKAVDAAEALLKGAVPVKPERLAELENKARRLAETAQRVMAEGEVAVPRERLEELEDKERRLDSPTRRVLAKGEVPVPQEHLAELEEKDRLTAGRGAAETARALELRDALDPYGEDSNKALLDRIRSLQAKENAVDSRLAKEEQDRRNFMNKLRHALSDLVKRAGGKIGPRGRITFPDKAFFETGSAEIPARSKKFLDNICSRWLATLKESPDRFDIDEIRIEGHSSSEWADARTERDAWIENLGLSQQRAQSVLVHCLDYVGQTPLGDWARGKLTAVGYSSSRLVTTGDGQEDKEASRRIELGYEVSRGGRISDPGGAAEAGGDELRPRRGPAQVIDGDTIRIGKFAFRLDGIDAPERGQTCTRDGGSEWRCGLKATAVLQERIVGREVVCDRLRLDLGRFRGRCRVAGGSEDLNRWLVLQGWAFAYVKFSKDYAGDEAAARKARRGIWSGRAPMPPWEWRRKRAAAAKPNVR